MKTRLFAALTFMVALATVSIAVPRTVFSAGTDGTAVGISSGTQVGQSSSTLSLSPCAVEFITQKGGEYGLSLSLDKKAMLHVVSSASSVSSQTVVESSCAVRLGKFLSGIPKGQEDAVMANALKLFFTSYNSKKLKNQ